MVSRDTDDNQALMDQINALLSRLPDDMFKTVADCMSSRGEHEPWGEFRLRLIKAMAEATERRQTNGN